jgi:hypothetical protein
MKGETTWWGSMPNTPQLSAKGSNGVTCLLAKRAIVEIRAPKDEYMQVFGVTKTGVKRLLTQSREPALQAS